jgi:hypothetical protein
MDITLLKKHRGRPYGHRLSEKTKDKIRQKRIGMHHSPETRTKISKALSDFFKKQGSVSTDMLRDYEDFEELVSWIEENSEYLDDEDNIIVTERRLSSFRQLEVSLGKNEIEQLFGHSATPEFLLLLKEELEKLGEDSKELISLV